jgi:DNA-binding protein H-NS
MKNMNLEAMPLDELWALHEQIGSMLTAKIAAEKRKLEKRLKELDRKFRSSSDEPRQRRPYPKVYPKFRNPEQPSQTWSGRGKQPSWVSQLLKAGKSIDDLRIPNA